MNSELEILACTPEAHAVAKHRLGLTGYVFFQAATVGKVTATAPCALMLKQTESGIYAYLSDPARTGKTVSVEIDLPRSADIVGGEGTTVSFDGKVWRVSC